MAAAATTGFPWGWDAVTAISTSVLVLGLGISVVALVLERRSDRQQRIDAVERDNRQSAWAVELQADAARRDLATRIMVEAYRILVDAPNSWDDTWMVKIQNPMSMLQLVMDDADVGLVVEQIKEFAGDEGRQGSSYDIAPFLATLRARIRKNLGIEETEQDLWYWRAANPTTRSLQQLAALWFALKAELAGDGSPERTLEQARDTARVVELLGLRNEREIVYTVTEEWALADRARREQLADQLRQWIRGTQQIFDKI